MPLGWKVIEPPTTATIAAKTKKMSFSGTGQQPEFGPLHASTKKLQTSFAARVDPAGGIASSIKKRTFSGTGKQTQVASMGMGLKKPSFQGSVVNQGVLGAGIKKSAFTGSGTQRFTGALGASLKKAQAIIAGSQTQAGTMAAKTKKLAATMAGNVPGVTLNALGTYAFGGGGGPINPTITIAPGSNTRLYAIVTVTHTQWLNSYSANKPAATSNVNGVFNGRITNVWLGNASGNRQGSIWLLELQSPTPGAHTVSVDCSASQGLSGIQAQLIAFDGVGSIGTIVTDSNPPSSGPPSLAAAALRAIDMHLVIMTHNTSTITFSGDWPSSPGLFVNKFQSQSGDAKAMRAAYLQGDGASKTFSSTNPVRYAIAHIPLLSP